MKFSLAILLLIASILSHLDVVDLFNYYGHSHKMSLSKAVNDIPKQEDDSLQKDLKENLKGQENYCSRNYFFHQISSVLLDNIQFVIAHTDLNIHPFTDTLLQPPQNI